jgi:hypothetical protein
VPFVVSKPGKVLRVCVAGAMMRIAGATYMICRFIRPTAAVAAVALGTMLAAAAAAQAQPARNGNVYNGTAHQPTQADVAGKEKQDGLPPPSPGDNTGAVDKLGQQLLHDEAVDPPRQPPLQQR